MTSRIDSILNSYLETYRGLIETERHDQSLTMSFPFHLAAGHRIEITVTEWTKGSCLISDSARTLGEVEAAGYPVTKQMKERLETLVSGSGARFVDTHLVLESTYANLGSSIQLFLEASKTIGDVYLVHKRRSEGTENEILGEVGRVLKSVNLPYRYKHKLNGKREAHSIDVFIPPNSHPGLALNVIGGQNTHALAQVWYCKCDDIRLANRNLKLALIYDVQHDPWTDASKEYLEAKADLVLPSDSIRELPKRLARQHIFTSQKRGNTKLRLP